MQHAIDAVRHAGQRVRAYAARCRRRAKARARAPPARPTADDHARA